MRVICDAYGNWRFLPLTVNMSAIPSAYRTFFLYVEPISALAGAYYAAFQPSAYLRDLSLASSIKPIVVNTTQINMALQQLANLYLLFALNEHLVLSSTSSITVWKRLLLVLLIADFGHLLTMMPLGWGIYWKAWEWNTMSWGNVGFVYLGALTRLSFLFDVGLSSKRKKQICTSPFVCFRTRDCIEFVRRTDHFGLMVVHCSSSQTPCIPLFTFNLAPHILFYNSNAMLGGFSV